MQFSSRNSTKKKILTHLKKKKMKKSNRCTGIAIPPSYPIVLAIFLMACSQVGTIKSMGIYLEDITKSLGTTPTDIGIALGLFAALSYFPAPLIAALYRLAWMRRPIIIAGAVLISLGVIMTSSATNNVFLAAYLALAGLGHCMLTISSTLALDQIAEGRRFNLLYGVGMSGFGLGMVLLPYAADILGQAYGWRGGLFILGGLMLNIVPCAMAIQTEYTSLCPNGMDGGPSDEVEESCQFEGECSEGTENANDDATPILDKDSPCGTEPDPHYQKSLKEQHPPNHSPVQQEQGSRCSRILDEALARFRRTDLYTDPVINFIFASDCTFGFLYCGWHAFLVPHALQRGYSVQSTIVMTLFASVGNFIGRLLAGVISYRLSNPMTLYLCAAMAVAFAILCDVLIQNYYVMAVSACLTAINIAAMAVLGPLAVRKRASPASFDIALGICENAFGLGNFIGGYLSGLVGEIYSSYDATFKLLIGADALVFLLMLPPFIFKKPRL